MAGLGGQRTTLSFQLGPGRTGLDLPGNSGSLLLDVYHTVDIADFVRFYNQVREHSSLDYIPSRRLTSLWPFKN